MACKWSSAPQWGAAARGHGLWGFLVCHEARPAPCRPVVSSCGPRFKSRPQSVASLSPPAPSTSSVPFPMAAGRPLLHPPGDPGPLILAEPSGGSTAPPRTRFPPCARPRVLLGSGRPPTRPWGGDGCGAVPSWTWVQILVATSRLCAGPHPCPGPCFLRCERGFLAATSWGLAEDRAVRGDPKLSAQHLEVITCSVDVACPSTPSPWAARPFEAWGSASPCRCPSPSTCLGA